MKEVTFTRGGEQFKARLVGRPGTKHIRLAWQEGAVPPAFAAEAVRWAKRPGLMTVLLPRRGTNGIADLHIEDAEAEAGDDRVDPEDGVRVQGAATAELAKDLALLLRERGLADRLQIICSHRGKYRKARKKELADADVIVCHIAMFLGEDHAFDTKVGVTDLAVATREVRPRAVVLIEVEEGRGGTKPKAVLGDSLLPIVADRVEIREKAKALQELSLDGAEVWVAYHPRKGFDVSRTGRLEEKFNRILARSRESEGVGPVRIRLFNEAPVTLYATLRQEVADVLRARFGQPGPGGGDG